MGRLILAVAALALLIAAAVYIGELRGERREHRRLAAEFQVLRAEVHQLNAALTASPLDDLEQVAEYRQMVAAVHRPRWAPALATLTAHFTHRRAA